MILLGLFLATPDPVPAASQLGYFVGAWACQGHFEPSKRPAASRIEFAMDEVTGSLVKRHADRAPGHYRSAERWDYTPSLSIYRAAVSDRNGGMRWYTSTGWNGLTWTWDRVIMKGEIADQFAYRRIDQATMQVDWSIARAGLGLSLGDTLRCTRTT